MKSRLFEIQLALFFKDPINRPDRLVQPLDKMFDTTPLVLPLDEDAPTNVPIVQMKSKNAEYVCNISRNRIDFFFTPKPKRVIANFVSIQKELEKKLEPFVRQVSTTDLVDIQISRIGFVAKYFFEVKDPHGKLNERYIREDLGKLRDLSLRFNKKNTLNGKGVNDITNIQTGALTVENKKKDGLLVQRDINTLQKEKPVLSRDFLISFIKNCYVPFSKESIERLL